MTNRERMTAVMNGQKPDKLPFAIYGETPTNDPVWCELYEQGLCIMPRVTVVKESFSSVETLVTHDAKNGYNIECRTIRTPIGEVREVYRNGWQQEFFLKTPADYRVMQYIVENSTLEADYSGFYQRESEIGNSGMTIVRADRSPIQKIIVDFAGLENFSYHQADDIDAVHSLIYALTEKMVRYFKLVADCPSLVVQIPENLTSDQVGPDRYCKYHMPFYEKIIPNMHSKGKKVLTHYDGKIACLIDLIAKTSIDGLESLTTPPEGDLNYIDVRKSLPDKIIGANIGLSDYRLPLDKLKAKVKQFIEQAAPDGRNLFFEISEDLPPNWKQTLPAILKVL